MERAFGGDGGVASPVEDGYGGGGVRSGSFKGSRRRAAMRPSLDADEFMTLLHGSDPVKVELNRLENEVREKDRELGEAQAEIKALRLSERAREKAVEEVSSHFSDHALNLFLVCSSVIHRVGAVEVVTLY
ncbi:unnamed protein product [Rhodiola kirilowii]